MDGRLPRSYREGFGGRGLGIGTSKSGACFALVSTDTTVGKENNMCDKKTAWVLSRIVRIKDGLHEITFNVDEQPAVKLTIKGSFSLQGCSVEGVLPAA